MPVSCDCCVLSAAGWSLLPSVVCLSVISIPQGLRAVEPKIVGCGDDDGVVLVASVRLGRQRFQLPSGGARFEYRQSSHLSLRFCVVFLSRIRQMRGYYFKLGNYIVFHNFYFIFHCRPVLSNQFLRTASLNKLQIGIYINNKIYYSDFGLHKWCDRLEI